MPAALPLPSAATLPPGFVDMLVRGVSCMVSACSTSLEPSIMRAVGTLVRPDQPEITVFLSRKQAGQLLQDIRDTGRLAAVFSEPSTHQTVQLKARQPQLRDARAADVPVLQRYLAAMENALGQVGLEVDFARAMLAHRLEDLVALSFVPEQAFDQTPGPKAGAAMATAHPGPGQE